MKKILILLTGLLFSISSLQAQNPSELDLTFNSDGINFRVPQIERTKQFKVYELKSTSIYQITV